MCAGRLLLIVFSVFFSVVIMIPGIGAASTLSGLHKIMELHDAPIYGEGMDHKDINGVSLTLNGKQLRLAPTLSFTYKHGRHIVGGYVHLMSADGQDYLSFPVEAYPSFRVYKFQNEAGQEFLLVFNNKNSVTDTFCRGLWVVGEYGDQYVTFATLESVTNAGLLYEDIVPKIENGELHLLGIARDRDCRTYDPQTNIWTEGIFKGHPVQPYGPAYCYVNYMSLFWDTDAQWFGIRRAN